MKTNLLTMKMTILTVSLFFSGVALILADPAPKLMPRPIPGLDVVQPVAEPRSPAPRPPILTPSSPGGQARPDQARVVFIHRRSTLPAELTKDLPARDKKPIDSFRLQVKPSPIKIIPKQRAADLAKAQD